MTPITNILRYFRDKHPDFYDDWILKYFYKWLFKVWGKW